MKKNKKNEELVNEEKVKSNEELISDDCIIEKGDSFSKDTFNSEDNECESKEDVTKESQIVKIEDNFTTLSSILFSTVYSFLCLNFLML